MPNCSVIIYELDVNQKNTTWRSLLIEIVTHAGRLTNCVKTIRYKWLLICVDSITRSSPQWWSGRSTNPYILLSSRRFGDLNKAVRLVYGITSKPANEFLHALWWQISPIYNRLADNRNRTFSTARVERKWTWLSYSFFRQNAAIAIGSVGRVRSFVRHKMRQSYISKTIWPIITKFDMYIHTDVLNSHNMTSLATTSGWQLSKFKKPSKIPPPPASGGISRERYKQGLPNFTHLSGTTGPTNLPHVKIWYQVPFKYGCNSNNKDNNKSPVFIN